MASNSAHHIIGAAAGVAAAAIIIDKGAGGHHYLNAILALGAGYIGGIFPDRIEEAWWTKKRIQFITHRTWTHIVAFWVLVMLASYHYLHAAEWVPPLFGFACGCVSHVLADLPNPGGVPLFWKRKYSLNLWKSGTADWLVIALAWGMAGWLTDVALTDGKFSQWAWDGAKVIGKEWGGEAYQRGGELWSYLASKI